MEPVTIILIAVACTVIAVLLFFIIKNIASPKKLEAIPKLIKQGKTQSALKITKQILTKDPKNYTAHYYLGKIYVVEGKTDLALIEYKSVNENALFGQQLNELTFRKEYSDLLFSNHHKQEALKNLLLLTKLEPQNAENFYQIGHIYQEINRNDLALGFLKKCILLDKKHTKAHAELGLMFYKSKMFTEAKKEIDTALKISPETYSSYYYLGKILKEAKDLQGAIKAFEKAQRDPDLKQKAIIEHGTCYMFAGRYDNATVDFQRAIELDKNNSLPETLYAHYFLASCYEKTRQLEKAIEHWEYIYKRNKGFRDVASKLSEYKDLQSNDCLKDYLTSSNADFTEICKNVVQKVMKLQVASCDLKKWGCQITGVSKDNSMIGVRKIIYFIQFYREPEPVEDIQIHETIDLMKSSGSIKGYIFSSSGFTNTARRFAENRSVELADKQKLEAILAKAGA